MSNSIHIPSTDDNHISSHGLYSFGLKILLPVFLLASFSPLSSAQEWSMPSEAERCPSPWGEGDQRGSANLITPASIVEAMKLVKTGEMFELGEVLSSDPEESYINRNRVFNIYTKPTIPRPDTRVSSEELVITELGQIGTQLDGFAHQMYGGSFYNCFQFDEISGRYGYQKLGVEQIGTLISRGILIDIAGLKGVETIDPDYMITISDLQQALRRQSLEIQEGDAILIHTGWGKHRGRDNILYGSSSPGIGAEAGQWLAQQRPLLIGADNCCVEFRTDGFRNLDVHSMMLIQYGIYLIENMELEALADAGGGEFLFIVQPLKLKGATGSAVAPIAIR